MILLKLIERLNKFNLLTKRKEVKVIIHSNYICYCKETDKYYNLLPLKVNDLAYFKTDTNYVKCTILNINKDNTCYIKNYITNENHLVDRNRIYPFIMDDTEIVIGYIKGIYFIPKII